MMVDRFSVIVVDGKKVIVDNKTGERILPSDTNYFCQCLNQVYNEKPEVEKIEQLQMAQAASVEVIKTLTSRVEELKEKLKS
jgi:hypothetical protein